MFEEIAAHKRGDDLARLVHTVAFAAADERRQSLADGLAEVAERAGITAEDAETPYGNVLRALERGGAESAGSATRTLLAALLARGVALSPPQGESAEARVAEALLWLSTNTSIDALAAVDEALAGKAAGLWRAVATLVRRIDDGGAPLLGRAGAVIGASALRESTSAVARDEAQALATEVRDPIVRSLLSGAGTAADESGSALAAGELSTPPRHPVKLVLMSITGILLVMHVARLVGRIALQYRRPAEIRVNGQGVVLRSKTELLGRTLRERETVIPADGLVRATREVRFSAILLYTGLFTLALGSYFGVALFIDGARVGSPEMIGIGALLVMGGVGLDFLLGTAHSSIRGRCRVVLVPKKGPAFAVGDLEPAVADAAIARLKR
ncbi:Hypothetical protein A7982_02682 [Minicystis rosea]|nr:Hypothetical protein A7982_02682 [Minicystis rosea]